MAEETGSGRRASDDAADKEISELIVNSDNQKDKAILLILLKISRTLDRNTSITENTSTKVDGHIDRFDKHEEKENILLTKVRTVWWVLSGVLVIANGVALFILKHYAEEYTGLQVKVADHEKRIVGLEERRRLEDEIAKIQQKGMK